MDRDATISALALDRSRMREACAGDVVSDTNGLSIRVIRSYDPSTADKIYGVNLDTVLALAVTDERDITFGQKMSDAFAFLKRRIH